jgi:hypothetical protein
LDRPVFFIHVLKTGGTTLVHQIRSNVPTEARYPFKGVDDNMVEAKLKTAVLLSQPLARLESVRAFHPHMPYCVAGVMPGDPATITIVREPVERVVSHLKRLAVRPEWRTDPETIYADPSMDWWLRDHQTRVFALSTEDCPLWDGYAQGLMSLGGGEELPHWPIDDARFEAARQNLATVDVIGLTEDFDGLFDTLERTWGWTIDRTRRRNESTDVPVAERLRGLPATPRVPVVSKSTRDVVVSEALREQIATDNAHDLALYEFARGLVAQREGAAY